MKKRLFLLFFLSLTTIVVGQRNVKDSIIGTPWITVNYGAIWPNADLVKQFGFLNHLGFTAGYKTKRNWYYGMEANFMYGNTIHISGMLSHLVDSYGHVTDINGDIGKVVLFARGFNTNLAFGKLFHIFGPNRNSGLFVNGGFGVVAHKIRIDTQDQVIPSLELKYRKGYDRLAIGPNLHQFIGYAHMANRGLVNFYTGFYIQEGFTKNQRNIFFDQPDIPVSTKTMIDIQLGVKFGWFIPIYRRLPKDFYYN